MSTTIPAATNYPNPTVMIPCRSLKRPAEGDYQINFAVEWGTMGGTNKSVNCNLQNNNVQPFSQIVAMAVDNSDCTADVRFIFPDTGLTITLPAFSPYSVLPIFSNARNFFVVTGLNGQQVEDDDVTRFQLFNFMPPPVSVSISDEQQPAAIAAIDGAAVAVTAIIPAGNDGRLESASIVGFFTNNTANTATWRLIDGDGTVLAIGRNASIGGDFSNITAFENFNMKVPFRDGINFEITQSDLPAGSQYAVNLYYRLR